VFAFDACQIGAGRCHRCRARIARGLQGCLGALGLVQSGTRLRQILRGSGIGGLSGNQFRLHIARRFQRAHGRCRPLDFALSPRQPAGRGTDLRIGHAPFGLDPSLLGGGLRRGDLGLTRGAVGLFQRGGEGGAARLFLGQSGAGGVVVALQPLDGGGGIAGQAVGLALIFLQPCVLAGEILQLPLDAFQLRRQLRQQIALSMGIVAPVGQHIADLGHALRGSGLTVLGDGGECLRLGHLLLGGAGLSARRLGGLCRLAPAGEEHARLGGADHLGEAAIFLGGAGLTAQGDDLAVQPGHNVVEAHQIGLGRAQFLLGVAAADVKPGDACRLFQHGAAVGGLGGDHGGDAALADQSGRMRARRGIGKDQRHILGPAVAPVQAIGAARAALDAAHDLQRLALGVLSAQHHLGEIARGRLAVPAKITSSMPPPRIDLALLSPITQRMASSKLDLPQPLGPTTPVSPGSIRSSAGSTKLLKPDSLSRLIRMQDQTAPAACRALSTSLHSLEPTLLPLTKTVGVDRCPCC
jgi:hypothetical protein